MTLLEERINALKDILELEEDQAQKDSIQDRIQALTDILEMGGKEEDGNIEPATLNQEPALLEKPAQSPEESFEQILFEFVKQCYYTYTKPVNYIELFNTEQRLELSDFEKKRLVDDASKIIFDLINKYNIELIQRNLKKSLSMADFENRVRPFLDSSTIEPQNDNYYIYRLSTIEEGHKYEQIENAEPVSLDISGDFFIYHDNTGKYNVSEGRTGLYVARGDNMELAIFEANKKLSKNASRFNKNIAAHIIKFGISPRYLALGEHDNPDNDILKKGGRIINKKINPEIIKEIIAKPPVAEIVNIEHPSKRDLITEKINSKKGEVDLLSSTPELKIANEEIILQFAREIYLLEKERELYK